MALFNCKNTKSGGMTETKLWTNPTPAQQMVATTITLSDDMDNYDFIAVEYAVNYNTLTNVNRAYIRVSDLKNTGNTAAKPQGSLSYYTTAYAVRPFWYISDTSIRFGAGLLNNNTDIPLYVYGVKIG